MMVFNVVFYIGITFLIFTVCLGIWVIYSKRYIEYKKMMLEYEDFKMVVEKEFDKRKFKGV